MTAFFLAGEARYCFHLFVMFRPASPSASAGSHLLPIFSRMEVLFLTGFAICVFNNAIYQRFIALPGAPWKSHRSLAAVFLTPMAPLVVAAPKGRIWAEGPGQEATSLRFSAGNTAIPPTRSRMLANSSDGQCGGGIWILGPAGT